MWQRHTNEEADEYEIILFNPSEFDVGLMDKTDLIFFFLNCCCSFIKLWHWTTKYLTKERLGTGFIWI